MEQNNMEDILNKKVGTLERESKALSEKIITILGSSIKTKKSDGKEMTTPLVEIFVKHPDKPEEQIKISKIKVLINDKVICKSLWVQLDAEHNIQKSSSVDDLLKYHKVETIAELVGRAMDTVIESDTSNFLCLKAY